MIQRDYCHDDYYQCGKKDEYKSQSYIPAGAEDEDWDADLDPAESPLERAHQLYQADQGDTTQMDDHTIPHYYSSPPEPQPGSYPGGKQLTSRNTTYAELQDSLVTQEKEDLILQGRVETSMSTKTPSTEISKDATTSTQERQTRLWSLHEQNGCWRAEVPWRAG